MANDAEQRRIIYDVYDALGEAVRAAGGPKEVGAFLRPEMPADQASQWLRDCLNLNRREKIDPAQTVVLLALAARHGFHDGMQFIAAECGYNVSPIEPRDELAELQRAYIDSVREQKTITERMERLTRAPLAAVGKGGA